MTYFFILIAVELAFLLLPIVLSSVEILKEWHISHPAKILIAASI